MDQKEDRDEYESQDIVKNVNSSHHPDGRERKEAERNSAEPSIEIYSVNSARQDEEDQEEAEDLHGNRGNEIEQIEDENLVNSAILPSGSREDVPGMEFEDNPTSTTLDPNSRIPPTAAAASAHEKPPDKEGLVALPKEVEEKLVEEKVPNWWWSPEQGPNKRSVVNSGDPNVENAKEGSLVDGAKGSRIEYFCEPNQNLTSDSLKIFFYHMLPFTTIPPLSILAFLWWAYIEWGWTALLFYTAILALLATSTPVYSRRFREALSGHFYGLLARYVPSAQYVVPEKPFPEDRPYIFACHPHGRMFYSTIIFSQLHHTWRKNILQKGDLFMTAAGMFFHVPLVRNLFYLLGVIPAGKGDIIAKLRRKDHVTILIGGVKEVMLGTEDDVDRIYLKHRKGFCKIAIQERTGVVPVYFFNENQMFMHNSKSFLAFWERVNKYFKVGVPFMRGRFLILPMPFRRPLMVAVGEPLFPREGESVDDFHERYKKALRELFDKYVPYSPKPDHKLIIQ
ncbi:unnamed protein product [Calypogeia fissa]